MEKIPVVLKPLNDPQVLSGSFRDPSGFLFRHNGILYRQINPAYGLEYEHLMSSGLYKDLVRREYLIPHEEVEAGRFNLPSAHRVIQPTLVSFISYPYEWCFGQLKEAALLTLEIQRIASGFGMALKDASAYNVQFLNGKPIWIDTLSFERSGEGQPWVAYRQFCQHFLAPLALAAFGDPRLVQLSRIFLDGIPLDLASSLLPFRTRWNLPISAHLHLHSMAQKHLSRFQAPTNTLRVSSKGLKGLLDHLHSTVHSLRWNPLRTSWSDYYETSIYSSVSLETKRRIVETFLSEIHPPPGIAWDLGANTGRFSQIPASRGILTVAMDADPACVEHNFRQMRKDGEKNLLPLVVDLANPSSSQGWAHQERLSLTERGPADVVLALALIHHLAIGNNLPFKNIAGWLRHLGSWLIIEFVPKTDPQVSRLLASRKDTFPEYHSRGFEVAFEESFILLNRVPIAGTGRTLYRMCAKATP